MSQLSSRHNPLDDLSSDAAEVTRPACPRARVDNRNNAGTNDPKPKTYAVGDVVFGFRLRQELGRGVSACVFLAEQADLAGRPVALKITDLEGEEPQTLARLQHTHIVPIYSVHENRQKGIRAVCMPYFGGASLAEVLKILWAESSRPAKGEQLVRALQAVPNPSVAKATSLPAGPGLGSPGPAPLTLLRSQNYVDAVASLVARLAEALQHAHQRGVIHRDIKPSNILLSEDGQAMLLDFNVAQTTSDGTTKVMLGGTIAYMAPEHLRALGSQDPNLHRQVDHRADIYSLGIVLYEALTNHSPFTQKGSQSALPDLIELMAMERARDVASLRQRRPDVPWSLESICRKCLAPDPALRYQQAEHLAEDLRRFLDNGPLKYAPELSWNERVRKFLRRHPRLTSTGTVSMAAVLLLAGVTAGLFSVREHLARVREELVAVQARDRMQEYEAGTLRALCLVNTTCEVEDHLLQGITVCEKTLALYGVLDSENWQEDAHWQQVAPEDRQRLTEDTRELLLSLAWARVRTTPGDRPVLTRSLALLDRAQAINGLAPCRAIWEDRAIYLDRLGRSTEAKDARQAAEQLPPTSARDHYLLATTYARSGRYDQAVRELTEALRLNPRHYWSLVQRGICYQEVGKLTLATGDFSACVGLWGEFSWGYFNRGYVLEKSGHRKEAIDDYTAALERDPTFILPYLNRGLSRLELKQYTLALADFRKAAELGRDDASLHLGTGVALEGLGQHPEADAAFRTAFARAESASSEMRKRISWVYGFAISKRLPAQARQAFGNVLRQQPDHPQALYGQAMLLVQEGREREALSLLTKALEASPAFIEACRYRAVLLARAGQFGPAFQDINASLEREPQSGATLYAAACVASLALGQCRDSAAADQLATQSLTFLRKAFALGYGQDQAAQDFDLKALKRHPEFTSLLRPRQRMNDQRDGR